MDYEQKYKEALERARKIHNGELTITRELLHDFDVYEYIFPELKESEDERIRKDIIRYIKKTSPAMGENIEHMVAWLEKQGEQNPTCSEEQKMESCGDNRFEIIEEAKQDLIKSTNIETSEDEMKVLDRFLFRCWQMGWLDRYDVKVPNNERSFEFPSLGRDDCYHGGPCTNPHYDCINCPRQFSGGTISTDGTNLNK